MATAKERIWLAEYMKCLNATEAARRAAYKWPGKIGAVNKKKFEGEIKAFLESRIMSAEEVLARLGEQASAEYSQYIKDNGVFVRIDTKQLIEDGKAHLIKNIKNTQYGQVIEFYDAKSALDSIGKYHALFAPKGDADDPNINVTMTVEEWREEQERRRKEQEGQTGETLDIFDELGDHEGIED